MSGWNQFTAAELGSEVAGVVQSMIVDRDKEIRALRDELDRAKGQIAEQRRELAESVNTVGHLRSRLACERMVG